MSREERLIRIESQQFAARSRIVKDYLAAYKREVEQIPDRYKAEINYRPRVVYFGDHIQWMKRDIILQYLIKQYPVFLPLLNLIFEETRYPRRKISDDDKELLSKWLKRYDQYLTINPPLKDGKDHYAMFDTSGDFYERMINLLKQDAIVVNLSALKRWIDIFVAVGICKEVGRMGSAHTRILSDGYYSDYQDGLKKHPFLTKTLFNKIRKQLSEIIRKGLK